MQIGMIGLGKMGLNMVRRLLRGGHEVVVFNRTPDKVATAVAERATGTASVEELVSSLKHPRVVWLMLPAGDVVDSHILQLSGLLETGDIIVEGGNSFYKDDLRRSANLAKAGIRYMDVGVSGGIWGLSEGYCLMAGGEKDVFDHLAPVLKTLAPPEGYLYCGAAGAGHFVKMVHNGIEYGMMQAYGEGFALLEASPFSENLNFAEVAHLWNQGSVVRSWLLELAEKAFANDPRLANVAGFVSDSGEGRWTVDQAVELGVSAPVIALSLFSRFQSRKDNAFENRLLAALRREFGGHAVKEG